MYQCAIDDLAVSHSNDKMRFPLAWQLTQRLIERFEWPIKGTHASLGMPVRTQRRSVVDKCRWVGGCE